MCPVSWVLPRWCCVISAHTAKMLTTTTTRTWTRTEQNNEWLKGEIPIFFVFYFWTPTGNCHPKLLFHNCCWKHVQFEYILTYILTVTCTYTYISYWNCNRIFCGKNVFDAQAYRGHKGMFISLKEWLQNAESATRDHRRVTFHYKPLQN